MGSSFAKKLSGFGARVIAHDKYKSQFSDEWAHPVSLEELQAEADIVSLHLPLNDETRGMIGKRELGRLPARSVVVNMARGGIVEETALLAALETDQLRGAVLDVFTAEPLAADSPLRSMWKISTSIFTAG
jgi:D-3-phosphoglycerate dehydrogenase